MGRSAASALAPRLLDLHVLWRRSAKLSLAKQRMQYGLGLLIDDLKRCVTCSRCERRTGKLVATQLGLGGFERERVDLPNVDHRVIIGRSSCRSSRETRWGVRKNAPDAVLRRTINDSRASIAIFEQGDRLRHKHAMPRRERSRRRSDISWWRSSAGPLLRSPRLNPPAPRDISLALPGTGRTTALVRSLRPS